MSAHHVSQSSFDANHTIYDKVRPGYRADPVNALIENLGLKRGSKIIELAAGTGKFTESIADKGFDITAVEPSTGMIESFKNKFDNIPIIEGSSYKIPLPDGEADALIVAQAYHWFADHKSLKEMARVLKPHGRIGLIWNHHLEDDLAYDNWSKKLLELIWSHDSDLPQFRRMTWKKSFENQSYFKTPYEEEDFKFMTTIPKDADFIYNWCLSLSFITRLPEKEKSKLHQSIQRIIEEDVKEDDLAPDGMLKRGQGTLIVWTEKM